MILALDGPVLPGVRFRHPVTVEVIFDGDTADTGWIVASEEYYHHTWDTDREAALQNFWLGLVYCRDMLRKYYNEDRLSPHMQDLYGRFCDLMGDV